MAQRSTLQQQLDRLHIDIPIIRHAAVEAIFELLKRQGLAASREGSAAIQKCLQHSSQVIHC